MKQVNYKVGALKRKFQNGAGDFEPGTFINKMNAQKTAQNKAKTPPTEKVAIMGMI